MNEALRAELLQMRDEDQAVRVRDAAGSVDVLRVRAVDDRHGQRLEEIVNELGGWPTPDLVGKDGSDAAWLVLQHAVSRPALQRRCLKLLIPLGAAGKVPKSQIAYVIDRIRMFEGRPQVYGTQFVWSDGGELVPHEIEDAATVDQRRATVGLPPLEEHMRRVRASAGPPPADVASTRRAAEAFARETGWR